MIIPPAHLLLFWTTIGGIAFVLSVWIGTDAARAGGDLLLVLREGYAIRYLDALAVSGGLVLSVLCLIASIYAAVKIRELLEG